MTVTSTLDIPSIDTLTAEQKRKLLTLLVKDELDRVPIPRVIAIEHEGRELGQLVLKHTPPAKSTPYPFTAAELEEIAQLIENPGPTLTLKELLVLEKSGGDAFLLR